MPPDVSDDEHPASGGHRANRQPAGTAKDRALRLLGVRWRSREELRRRLLGAGFEQEQVDAAVADLEAVGLVDDERFARELVADRAAHRLAGNRGIRAALRQKGVAAEVAERALEGAGDEEARARSLAEAKAARMSGLDPDAAYRRLFGLLVRRGFAPALASRASREALRPVLPPEGALEPDA